MSSVGWKTLKSKIITSIDYNYLVQQVRLDLLHLILESLKLASFLLAFQLLSVSRTLESSCSFSIFLEWQIWMYLNRYIYQVEAFENSGKISIKFERRDKQDLCCLRLIECI